MTSADDFQQRASKALHRVASANQPAPRGVGMHEDHFIPLCQFHQPNAARELKKRLEAKSIAVRLRATRMYTYLSVPFEERELAFRLLEQFKKDNPVAGPTKYTGDYDLLIFVGIFTSVISIIVYIAPFFPKIASIAVATTGISCGLVIERGHRRKRRQQGSHFSIAEILSFTFLVALNIAVWSWVF